MIEMIEMIEIKQYELKAEDLQKRYSLYKEY